MKIKSLVNAVAVASLVACGGGGGGSSSNNGPVNESETVFVTDLDISSVEQVLETNADIAFAAYSDSVDTAEQLQAAINTLANEVTQENLDAAKLAWLVAREPYGQTEVYRFRLSPIDSTDYESEDGPEGAINAWPLGEALIDYVVEGTDFGGDQLQVDAGAEDSQETVVDYTDYEYPGVNIINSGVPIDEDLLSNTASSDSERDVIGGYHAIEFLLWGQDLNRDGSADTEGMRDMNTTADILNSGGQRPLSDFTDNEMAGDSGETLGQRRLQFMQVAVSKLISDLEGVRDSWVEGADYREMFTTVVDQNDAEQKLTEILTGMGTLSRGELAGERMQIAFSLDSQEDEHSCFSDNTHRDIWLNAEGVSNSYYGVYGGYDSDLDGVDDVTDNAVDGFGFDDLTAAIDIDGFTALAETMEAALDVTESAYNAIDESARVGQPVDVLIQRDSDDAANPIALAIVSLDTQASAIQDFATGLGLDGVVDDATDCDTSDPTSEC